MILLYIQPVIFYMWGNRVSISLSGSLCVLSINNKRSKEQGQGKLDPQRRNVLLGKP